MASSTSATWSFDLTSSLVLACVAGLILGVFYWYDKDMDMRRHFMRNHPFLYATLQLCVVMLSVAIAFNMRFVSKHVFGLLWSSTLVKKKLLGF